MHTIHLGRISIMTQGIPCRISEALYFTLNFEFQTIKPQYSKVLHHIRHYLLDTSNPSSLLRSFNLFVGLHNHWIHCFHFENPFNFTATLFSNIIDQHRHYKTKHINIKKAGTGSKRSHTMWKYKTNILIKVLVLQLVLIKINM